MRSAPWAVALGEQARGRLVDPRLGKVPFAVYSADWPGLRPKTRGLYDSQLRTHLVAGKGR